jgi:hypothetical protein
MFGLALLFAAGKRPATSDIVRLAEASNGASGFGIAHRPSDDEGWIELQTMGLSFDCLGLAPAEPCALPPMVQLFELAPEIAGRKLEAIELSSGSHLAGGERTIRVLRGMIGLGAQLAGLAEPVAICWRPAGSWMAPDYFHKIASDWLSGGAFPALGLTSLERRDDGAMASRGLACLTGQELLLRPISGASAAETAQIARQLIGELVYSGPLRERAHYAGPRGEDLIAEPDEAGTLIVVDWVR